MPQPPRRTPATAKMILRLFLAKPVDRVHDRRTAVPFLVVPTVFEHRLEFGPIRRFVADSPLFHEEPGPPRFRFRAQYSRQIASWRPKASRFWTCFLTAKPDNKITARFIVPRSPFGCDSVEDGRFPLLCLTQSSLPSVYSLAGARHARAGFKKRGRIAMSGQRIHLVGADRFQFSACQLALRVPVFVGHCSRIEHFFILLVFLTPRDCLFVFCSCLLLSAICLP